VALGLATPRLQPGNTGTKPFGFGAAPQPAAAPAAGGFSFGAPAPGAQPAPAPFGAPSPAPTGGGLFGSQPAPAPGAFGSTPAPSGGFGFGAPSPAPGAFGAPAPGAFGAPAPGGAFGAPAPATTGFGFGTAAQAPGGFGSPAPGAGGFGFGQPAAPTPGGFPATGGALGSVPLNGKTPYSSLPPEYKKAIDTIHEAMMKHKRSMIQVQAMGPHALMLVNKDEALPPKLKKLHQNLNVLQQNVASLQATAEKHRDVDRRHNEQSVAYAKWPTQAIGARRGVRLSTFEEKKDGDPDVHAQIREMLERQQTYVDRIERMPSPYFWQILDHMSQRLNTLTEDVTTIRQQLETSESLDDDVVNLTKIIDNQDQIIYVLRREVHKIHYDMDKLRKTYSAFETGENVLDKAQLEEWERQKVIDEQIQMQLLRATAAPGSKGNVPPTPGVPGQAASAPAPSSGFSFSSAPAPGAPAGAAPSSSGFSFGGSAPAPAPFGAPAATPGAPPAFGAPAPAFGATAGFAKPASSAPANKKKSSARGGKSKR